MATEKQHETLDKAKKRTRGFFKGFKEFISKGNMIDLAIGVIIGTAFGAVITALVNGIIMPPFAYLIGGNSFDQLRWVISPAVATVTDPTTGAIIVQGSAEIAIKWGAFVQALINFLIIAFTIYMILTLIIRRKQFNDKLAAEEAAKNAPPPAPVIPDDVKLLTEIRDLLKTNTESK